jgi:predicted small lipoprotein YifL
MLREITATIRTRATVVSARAVATVVTIVLAGALIAGCGIKGPLKLPPPAATPSGPATDKAAAPGATTAPAPAAEPALPPAKP